MASLLAVLLQLGIERVADAVAEEREREHGDRDGDRRETRRGASAERRYCCPSPTIWPHDGVGGLMPTPMNESAASVKIASGMPKVTATTMGDSAFGRMWRTQEPAGAARRARARRRRTPSP